MSEILEGHTVRRYDGELNTLHLLVLEMGGLVLEQCREALEALKSGDLETVRRVLTRESQVDALELKLDDNVWWVVGRRGPVARDLRVVMAFAKAVADLERIGDEAVRIAHTTLAVYDDEVRRPSRKLLRDVQTMGRLAVGMLQDAVALYDTFDLAGAESLVQRHHELDAEFQSSLRRLSTFILEDARNVGHAINAVLLVKALERIGDHARNLAEYVIYLVRGEDVRHGGAHPPQEGAGGGRGSR
ncbi:MAG: phosphate signaling complex protein PhoU [Burkholderiales bacterium]|nr:phosphate signaling complex protein PhoU [Burkholderiales bacterium]